MTSLTPKDENPMANTNGFTNNADLYRTSLAHSEVEDLELCLDALPGLSGLEVLDVATGSGHTAFYFARKGCHTFAVDVNREMLRVAEEESDRQTLSVRFLWSQANDLNFDENKFDLVTCRLAAHHFEDVSGFLSEARRVLRPGGHILVVDNVVPTDDDEVARWLNEYERKRDDSHQACWTKDKWSVQLEEQGFSQKMSQRFKKTLLFDPWMERMSKTEGEREVLWEQLLAAPQGVLDYWRPKSNEKCQKTLRLQRQVMVFEKK